LSSTDQAVNSHAITFDFHETIAHCDQWFQLEVHRLPSALLTWWATESGQKLDLNLAAVADAAYRRLRLSIHRHGHELPAERCLFTIAESLNIPMTMPEIERGVHDLMRSALDSVTPVQGVIETIARLSNSGIGLGIVSSAVYHPYLLWTLQRFGIDHHFAWVTTSASAGYYKSRPEIYWQAIARLGATPASCVHVGDSLRFDVAGAKRAGLKVVWLNHSSSDAGPNQADLTLTTMCGAATPLIDLLNGRA
jgi:HAD superfamily hydrolase (TIGR01509 family)